MIDEDAIVQFIGQSELSLGAAAYDRDDQYLGRAFVRDIRKLAGLEKALIVFDETQKRYRVVTAKKAAARLARRS